MPRNVLLFAVLTVGWVVVSNAEPAQLAVPAQNPVVTDPKVFFEPSWDFFEPVVSPNGLEVGFMARTQDHACLYQLDLATGRIKGLFKPENGDLVQLWWLTNERILFSGRGGYGIVYYSLSMTDGKMVRLHSLDNVDAGEIRLLADKPDSILVGRHDRSELIDSRTDSKSVFEVFGEKMWSHVFSASGELRAGLNRTGDYWTTYWRSTPGQPWQKLELRGTHPAVLPLAMTQDDKHVVVIAYDQGNTAVLMLLDPIDGRRTLVASRPDRDISGAMFDAHTRALIAADFYESGQREVQFLDDSARAFDVQLSHSLPGTGHLVRNTSQDGNRCVIEDWSARTPPTYYLFDRTQKHLTLLGMARPDIDPHRMGETRSVHFSTRDGLDETGYVLLPPGFTGKTRCPVVVFPTEYVGQTNRPSSWFNGGLQYFASRGYAVAIFAVRGTMGFGRALEQAGNFELGDKIILDTQDGVESLVRDGLADPNRVAIVGFGFTGALALRGASNSTAFHAVIAMNPQTEFDATDIPWESSSNSGTYETIEKAGGTNAAYSKVHEFEPAAVLPKLSAPLLLIYNGQFGHEYPRYSGNAGLVRRILESNRRPYEWYVLEPPSEKLPKEQRQVEYLERLSREMVDFLDRTLKDAPGAK